MTLNKPTRSIPSSSINSVGRGKALSSISNAGHSGDNAPASSISHMGKPQEKAKSSILGEGRFSAKSSALRKEGFVGTMSGEMSSDERDERRYDFMRRLIRQRKVKDAAGTEGKYKVQVKTGSAFKKGGASGFHKRLRHHFKKYRSTYQNVSEKEGNFFEGVVEKQAKNKRTGSEFNRLDKKKMKSEIHTAFKKGKVSREDQKDFYNMIDKL
ncbi:MAG: hypothetical protein HOE80_01685 [Candidatus Magasanikbacteria bacterium]|jgi:hypothetical protein|nr:hypothetical protein [Candidatus Magasanikbacteria bacterium]MBT4071413.1 hypothetical protein [Candidatus Magasanikbacteria bacterium]